MYVDFDQLSETSRVWIFQANRSFTEEELAEIEGFMKEYINNWTSHGTSLRASFELRYKRFLIVAADENQHLGGCSIDDMVRIIQELEKKYQVDLLDKMNVSFKQGEFIAYKPLNEFKKMVQQKSVSAKTIVFNNLVTNIYEYRNDWEVPLEDSWHSRFL
ncbi:ABC transporter ATPase [Capnocytophaga catalasegens]|uniref:ABC transporter ATPase n=1 Tax=Capnocytophaga catalasegens TaxID=1004260 RepID=A0AAV5B0I4_9FLAO|nr:ABC transporter ATPase [Capnocytophaga catalasegens]GIZ14785.1 hypothetical protein RCZ03_07850 [Capnocytophaga catalasegens]GJM51153.1 hypothetical protein RCZ15_21260 [Capnocytophaga catalasegens]GJM53536.1 hypothetical protein RCZ16_18520 [Capnocytophaga catalasegens]